MSTTPPLPAGRLALAAVLGLLVVAAGCGPEGFVDRWPQVETAPPLDVSGGVDGGTSHRAADPSQPPLDAAANRQAPAPSDSGPIADRFPAATDLVLASGEVPSSPVTPVAIPVAAAPIDAAAPADANAADAASTRDPGPPPEGADRLVVRSAPGRELTALTGRDVDDWIHWAYQRAGDVTRKRGVPPRIAWSLLGEPRVGRYDDRATWFTWSDGTPIRMADTRAGAVVGGEVGEGFRLLVSGPTGQSRLTLHLGAWNAQADLRVRVERSGIEGPSRSREERAFLDAEQPGRDRIASVDFGPLQPDQQLVVEWTLGDLHHPQGNVTLQAATLSSPGRFD